MTQVIDLLGRWNRRFRAAGINCDSAIPVRVKEEQLIETPTVLLPNNSAMLVRVKEEQLIETPTVLSPKNIKGASICEHGRIRRTCKECGGCCDM